MVLQAKFKGSHTQGTLREGALEMPQSGGTMIIPVSSVKRMLFNEKGMSQYPVGDDGTPATFYMEYGDSSYYSWGYNLRAIKEMYKAALAGQYVSYDEYNQLYPKEDKRNIEQEAPKLDPIKPEAPKP